MVRAWTRPRSISSAPWLYYKLVNVQYFPYDKVVKAGVPNGSPYTSQPPFTAQNPEVSSYYLANILVETNRSLQLFSGGLSPQPKAAVVTGWDVDGTPRITVEGARANNLDNVTVGFPLGCFTCVTGVSGGGKSSLVIETLYKAVARRLNGAAPGTTAGAAAAQP